MRKGVWIFRSLSSLIHIPADLASGLSNMTAPLRGTTLNKLYVLPIQTEHYLRRILTLGKPSHFSLHSGHSVFFEEAHHKARQCRQKLCPQFKVVGLIRMS